MTAPTPVTHAGFRPTPAMIEAAETLFAAMAFEQTVRPIVEGYQRKILAERTWHCAPEYIERVQRRTSEQPVKTYINDIKLAWTMESSDYARYLKRCDEERIAAGLVVESESHCPLLFAEDMTRKAKYALCDAMASVTKIPADAAVVLKRTEYEKLIDLSLRVLAPFVKNPLGQVAR